ncbi:putative polysaccharide biosynthesis protein [Desulfonema limicola]|uniref:Polysaccharide biosynthesis protein n=1 Tax=Desulfonema limicola TaxID=45656 RepID=A0A975BDR6_9BACT|nr:flippase [Desulfonema limicola]QTA83335.1 putative polysaccharide biosynthesis protein [Desulfonema limicola]
MITNKILKNTFVLIAGRLFSRILQFFLFIYAARCLGADIFGIFSFAYALVSLFSISMDMGISSYSVQQVSRDNEKMASYVGASLTAKVFLIILGFLLIMGTGIVMQKDELTLSALFIMGICASFDNVGNTFQSVFEAHEDMHYQAAIIAFSNFIMCVAGFALLWFFQDVLLFCATYAFGAFLRCTMAAIWVIKTYGPPLWTKDFHFITNIVKKGMPFALVTIFVSIYYYIDTLILSVYCENDVVGYYNASYRLLEAPLFIISSVTTAIFPAASKLYGKDKIELANMVRQAFQKALGFGFSMSLVVAWLSYDLIELIYGKEYLPSAAVLPILIYSVAIIMPSTICGTTIRAIDMQSISAKVTGIGALLNVVLNLILVPKYSLYGAAWTTLGTEIFVLAVYAYLVWHYIGPVINLNTIFSLLGLNALFAGFLWVSGPAGFWFQLIGSVILFFPFMIAVRLIKIEELKSLINRKLPAAKAGS